jgi:putative heme transporter
MLVLGLLFFRLFDQVDWAQVGDALGRLTVPELVLIALCVVVRQMLDATPLALFVPGLGLRRSMANTVTGYLVGTLAPAPSDMVLRMSMFRAWGIDAAHGAAGLALNATVYYIGRFSAPIAGLAVYLAFLGLDATYAWAALGGAVVAGFLVGVLVAVSRGRQRAFAVGHRSARIAARVTKRSIDPDAWGTRPAEFQEVSSRRLAERSGMAAASVAALLTIDATILVLSFRFVGLPSSDVSIAALVAAFLCVYPLTALPIAGLGFLDAGLISLLNLDATGEQQAVAAMVIWRVATLLATLAAGTIVLVVWRHSAAAARRGAEAGTTA